jgi:hypothetical protein
MYGERYTEQRRVNDVRFDPKAFLRLPVGRSAAG